MKYAVLRIRSSRESSKIQDRTLRQMHMTRVNHCALLPMDDSSKGMLKRVQHMIAWGEVDEETLAVLLSYRSNLDDDLTDDLVAEHTDFNTVEEFASGIISGKAKFSDIPGLKNLFRLHPPIGGYKGVKEHYRNGGSLGYRGKEINTLLKRMIGPENIKGE